MATRESDGASMVGWRPIGPSLPSKGHKISCSEPDVARNFPSADQSMLLTRAEYPDIRMFFASVIRQPCNVDSCIAVIRNLPSGLIVTARCEPFHSNFAGAAAAFGNQSDAPL